MLALVIGGSGSGKSEYAEDLTMKLNPKEKFYIATMYPWDEESRKRIEKHRKMRAQKCFQTLECFYHLEEGAKELKACKKKETTVLLDCMSNLVSNEMYCEEGYVNRVKSGEVSTVTVDRVQEDETCMPLVKPLVGQRSLGDEAEKQLIMQRSLTDEILQGIEQLCRDFEHVVIVSNDVFSDGESYSAEMQNYLSQLGQVNCEIAKRADLVAEVVCGIPIMIKNKGSVANEEPMEQF